MAERYHTIPIDDLREHDASPECWCNPVEDSECSDLYRHNSMDDRESYEQGRRVH